MNIIEIGELEIGKKLTISDYFDIMWKNQYLLYTTIFMIILFFIRIHFINKDNRNVKKKNIIKCIILYIIVLFINLIGLRYGIEGDINNYKGIYMIRGINTKILIVINIFVPIIIIFIELIIDKIMKKKEKGKLNVHK